MGRHKILLLILSPPQQLSPVSITLNVEQVVGHGLESELMKKW